MPQRLRAMNPLSWFAILVSASVLLGLLLSPFVWLSVSLILTFAFQEWTNALSIPVGRAGLAIGVGYYACGAWRFLVEQRNGK